MTPAEHAIIAAYVSSQNDGYFCQTIRGVGAAHYMGGDQQWAKETKHNFESAVISDKLKALLTIAGKVQLGGKQVRMRESARAGQQGATDKEIHDTVLTAAAFFMYNRCVDGLSSRASDDSNLYRSNSRHLSEEGHLQSIDRPSEAQKPYA